MRLRSSKRSMRARRRECGRSSSVCAGKHGPSSRSTHHAPAPYPISAPPPHLLHSTTSPPPLHHLQQALDDKGPTTAALGFWNHRRTSVVLFAQNSGCESKNLKHTHPCLPVTQNQSFMLEFFGIVSTSVAHPLRYSCRAVVKRVTPSGVRTPSTSHPKLTTAFRYEMKLLSALLVVFRRRSTNGGSCC